MKELGYSSGTIGEPHEICPYGKNAGKKRQDLCRALSQAVYGEHFAQTGGLEP